MQAIKATIFEQRIIFLLAFNALLIIFCSRLLLIPHWFLDAACLCTSRAKYSGKYKLLAWHFGYHVF